MWPTPNVIGLPFDARFGRWGGDQSRLYSPTQLPNLAAWFDALDTQTMLSGDGTTITDGGSVALWGDKSGNSGVNALVLTGLVGNSVTIPHFAALNTTDVRVQARITPASWTPALSHALAQRDQDASTARCWSFSHLDSGKLRLSWFPTGASASQITVDSTTGITTSAFTPLWVEAFLDVDNGAGKYVVTFKTSTNGVSWSNLGDPVEGGSTTNLFSGTVGVIAGISRANTAPFLGAFHQLRVYDGASTTTVLDIDFSTAGKKLANGDTFVCATGQTVTLNSSGATGARIAGERDWYMGTLASRGAYDAAGKYIATDGSDDYYKTAAFPLPQPITLYAVIEQTTWTSGDYLIDGSASDTLALIQTTTTPQINLSAGSSVAANADLAVATKALVTIVSNGSSSLVSINRLAPTTGNAGAGVPNGLTLAAKGTPGSYGNARYYEIAVYKAAHDQATRHRFALYAARKWGFAA